MAHVIFFARGTAGDLVPFPKIGEALKARGHDISLLSHCSYSGMAERNGWDFAALDTPEERQRTLEDGHLLNDPVGFPAFLRRHTFPRAVAAFEAVRERYVPGKTILVTTHRACLVPLLMAEKFQAPVGRLFTSVAELITFPMTEEMYREQLGQELNGLRGSVGLPPITHWDVWLRKADRDLALWPDWFAAPDNDRVVKAVPIGFVQETGEPIDADRLEMLRGTEPPILISAGTGLFTDPRFYTASAEACRIINRRGLLVTSYPQLLPDVLPEQVQHFDYLPFASLMPYVAAFVHHGGAGSVACALAAGVPQLALTAGGDRPENGRRLSRLGVGEMLPQRHWEGADVASALQRVLTSASVRQNCEAFAQRLAASDAAAEACRWIESVATNEEQMLDQLGNR